MFVPPQPVFGRLRKSNTGTGENNVAKNRIGVIKGDKKGDTKITVNGQGGDQIVIDKNVD